jgi:hypothetical protein
MRLNGLWILFLVFMYGCGSSSNINQLWLGSEDSADTLVIECRALYDAGEFDAAEEKCDKAQEMAPSSENAAILNGYVALSKGGIDPYSLARNLMGESSSGDDDDDDDDASGLTGLEGLLLGDDDDDDDDGHRLAESSASSASDSLSSLGGLIDGISGSDYDFLGGLLSEQSADGTIDLKSDLFDDSEIYIPGKVTDSMRDSVGSLAFMNKAVSSVCGFVNSETKIETDSTGRHNCDRNASASSSAKAHFLWAFSHLTEALIFQSVLIYTPEGDGDSFEEAAEKLNNYSGSGTAALTDFSNRVDDMNTVTDLLFDVTTENSMIKRTLDALSAVTAAFANMAGLPESMTSSITAAMTSITETAAAVGGDTSDVEALKGQMAEKTATIVAEKITEASEDIAGVSDEDFEDICSNLSSMTSTMESGTVDTPSVCD